MEDTRTATFVQAVREKREALWRVAYGILRSSTDVKDAVSAAVEAAWKHLGRIRSMDALGAYLTRCTVNAAYDALRLRKRTVPLDELPDRAAQEKDGIADDVMAIPEKLRVPLLLKFEEDLPEKEIARILRVPRGTVSSRICRGLALLKQQMQKEGIGHD